MDSAFNAALNGAIRRDPEQVCETGTVCTDVYSGPQGTGFQVAGQINIGGALFMRVRQHGPEIWREHSWDRTGMLAALDKAHGRLVGGGICVHGITLRAEESDRASFAQLVTLLREAEELQPDEAAKAAFRNSEVTITDIAGSPHRISTSEVRAMLVEYGLRLNSEWTDLVIAKAELSKNGGQ